MIRSLLFVPGDSARKFEKASQGPADALILDLEDSVSPAQKPAARSLSAQMLAAPRSRQQLYVRVNAFDTGLTLADLAAVMPARPDGIVLPKSRSGEDVRRLDHHLAAFEAAFGLAVGSTHILPIVTETASALFGLGSYADCSARLWGMMWGAEDLAAALGAFDNRDGKAYTDAFRMARNLCLAGARAAGVVPVDTVYVDIQNLDGLRSETLDARRDGFTAKALIHPTHVDVVHAAFMPSADEVAWAQQVAAAFESAPDAGVVTLAGKMIDKPHLVKARSILDLAAANAAPR
jgi:citrate lyase subunit beta / citryl-CoA lyase